MTRIEKIAKRFINLPPNKWDAAASKLDQSELMEVARTLDAFVSGAARTAAYVEFRAMGQSHEASVRKQNAVARKVRAALGYNTTHDVTF